MAERGALLVVGAIAGSARRSGGWRLAAQRGHAVIGLVISEGAPPCARARSAALCRASEARMRSPGGAASSPRFMPRVRRFPTIVARRRVRPRVIGMAQSLPPGTDRLSPSGLAAPGRACGRAMTAAEIDATIAAFAQTAAAFDRAVLETLD